MTVIRIALILALLTLADLRTAPSADAQSCESNANAGVFENGTYGGGGTATPCPSGDWANTSGYSVERYTRHEPNLCPNTPDGLREYFDYYDTAGNLVDTVSRCLDPAVPGDPVPPPPPAPTEVLQRLPLPMPEVHTSPPGQGLVGFETYLWWGADTTLPPLSVTVGDWTATVAPVLHDVTWDLGNGDTIAGNGAGTAQAPSARYTYQHQCDCTITLTATWGGTVTLSHPLLGTPIQQQAAGVPFTTTLAYDVVEREAVIVG